MKKRAISRFVFPFLVLSSLVGCSESTFTVTWTDEDGTVLEVDEKVKVGTIPTYDGTLPTKAATAQYTYSFGGWSPEVTAVVEDVTYAAQYSGVVNEYTVTWKNYDGTTLEVDENVPYGTTPTYDGATPTKEGDAQLSWYFSGWDSDVAPVTGFVTYIAQFTSSVNKYTVKWLNYDGSILEIDNDVPYGTTPTYDGTTPTKLDTRQYRYVFDKWSPEIVTVTGNAEYFAVFTEELQHYTVTFDANGGVLGEGAPATVDVEAFNKVAKPADPTRTGYTFAGWTLNGEDYVFNGFVVNEDITLVAKWVINQYTITFNSNGGSDVASITQDYNSDVVAPANPTKEHYHFMGWEPAVPTKMPASDITCVAKWEINSWTITFDTVGGTAIAPITQNYGTDVTAPADPVKTGYTFLGWDVEVPSTMPDNNVTITAQWQINQYTVTFNPNNGEEIVTVTQDYGTEIAAPTVPTRTGYTFVRWEPEAPSTMPAENVDCVAVWNDYSSEFQYIVEKNSVKILRYYGDAPEVTIPSNIIGYPVETISELAFTNHIKTKKVNLPSSLKTIGDNAFRNCTALESIIIPASVTSIGVGVFTGCTSLTSVKVADGNAKYDSRNNCNAVIETETNTLVLGCAVSSIPEGVVAIDSYAFSECEEITSVTLPSTLKTIGNNAFYRCTGLVEVVIPDSVTTICDYAFYMCFSLKTVSLGNGVAVIGSYAFSNCVALSQVTIPASVSYMGGYIFNSCSAMKTIKCLVSARPSGWNQEWNSGCNAIVEWKK